MPPAGALSVTSDRKYPKNAAKTNGFGFLARAWCGEHRDLLPRELNGATPSRTFALPLRLSTATRSALVLAGLPGEICAPTVRQREGTPPYGYLGGWCVQADVGIGPYKGTPCRAGPMCPAAHCTPCCVSLRGRCAHRLWRSAPPYLRRAEGSPPYGVLSENRP